MSTPSQTHRRWTPVAAAANLPGQVGDPVLGLEIGDDCYVNGLSEYWVCIDNTLNAAVWAPQRVNASSSAATSGALSLSMMGTLFLDTSGGATTRTMPAPTNGWRLRVVKSVSNANSLTFNRHAAEKINGVAANYTVAGWAGAAVGAMADVESDGTDFYVSLILP